MPFSRLHIASDTGTAHFQRTSTCLFDFAFVSSDGELDGFHQLRFTGATLVGSASPATYAISPGATGHLYFACQVGTHCQSGQKLDVTIGGTPTPAPTPATATASCPSTSGWSAPVVLDASIAFSMAHKVVGSTLHLKLSSSHTGWLGFGFGERTSGHMKGSDLVTARIVNGVVNVEDRHATFVGSGYSEANGTRCLSGSCLYPGLTAEVDAQQDWTIISGSYHNNTQEFIISRLLNTTDKQDRAIVAGVTRTLWAWGAGDTVGYHSGNRGVGE